MASLMESKRPLQAAQLGTVRSPEDRGSSALRVDNFQRRSRSPWRQALSRLFKSPSGLVGASILTILTLLAITADWIAPYPPLAVDPANACAAPSVQHLFGTDELGRDLLSRIVHGARISLAVGLVATMVSTVLGIVLGLMSGYVGGTLDALVMRLTDVFLAIPTMLMALVVISVLGRDTGNVMLAVGISGVPRFARVVRGTVLSAKENEYVFSARTIGCRHLRIVFRHILPNVIGPTIVLATIYVSSAILLAAGLSFLGMGTQPPAPEWGLMLTKGRLYLRAAPWITTFPGLAIMITVLAINLLGDALRDALDPRLTR